MALLTYYNMHNLVKFKLEHPKSIINFLLGDPLDKYKSYQVNGKALKDLELDFIIRICKFRKPNEKWTYESMGKFKFSQSYFYTESYLYKPINWQIEINNLDGSGKDPIEINVWGDFLSLRWIPNLIEFYIHYCLIKKDAALIHAAGLDFQGKGLIFSARSGGGKTTIALNSARFQRMMLLGDNFIILHKGKIYSFIGNISAYKYNLTKEAKEKIKLCNKLRMLFSSAIIKLTQNKIRLATLINLGELYPDKLGKFASINNGFVILPRVGNKDISSKKVDTKTFIDYLIENQKCDLLPVNQLISEYSFFYPDNPIEAQWKKYRTILEENLGDVKLYTITVPHILTSENINDIMELAEIIG